MTLIKFNNQTKPFGRSAFMPLFDEVLNDFWGGSLSHQRSAAVNIRENEKNYSLELAAPGFEKEEFKINLENNMLSISAEKKSEVNESEKNYTRREYSFTSFQRSFTLPEVADTAQIKAEYKNGILHIEIPKKAEEKKGNARQINVD